MDAQDGQPGPTLLVAEAGNREPHPIGRRERGKVWQHRKRFGRLGQPLRGREGPHLGHAATVEHPGESRAHERLLRAAPARGGRHGERDKVPETADGPAQLVAPARRELRRTVEEIVEAAHGLRLPEADDHAEQRAGLVSMRDDHHRMRAVGAQKFAPAPDAGSAPVGIAERVEGRRKGGLPVEVGRPVDGEASAQHQPSVGTSTRRPRRPPARMA